MKLYQAVKKYGLERVKFILMHPDDYDKHVEMNLTISKLKSKTVETIRTAFREAEQIEQSLLNYSAVDIALWYIFLLAREESHQGSAQCYAEPDAHFLCKYMLEDMDPSSVFVKAQKEFRKDYYTKKG